MRRPRERLGGSRGLTRMRRSGGTSSFRLRCYRGGRMGVFNVLECDGGFDFLSGEDGIFFECDEDANVG